MSTINENTEKRRFPRLEAKYLISFEYFDEDNTQDIEGMGVSQNLSLGGILIEIDKPVRMGATLFLEIALKDYLIKATGRIAHVKKIRENNYDIGITFIQISPDDHKVLQEYYSEKGLELE